MHLACVQRTEIDKAKEDSKQFAYTYILKIKAHSFALPNGNGNKKDHRAKAVAKAFEYLTFLHVLLRIG